MENLVLDTAGEGYRSQMRYLTKVRNRLAGAIIRSHARLLVMLQKIQLQTCIPCSEEGRVIVFIQSGMKALILLVPFKKEKNKTKQPNTNSPTLLTV